MSKLPLLGVICNRRDHDGGTGQSVNHTYLDAIAAWMNVQPILIPANRAFTDTQTADNLLSAVDGLLVTGNRSNVHPKNYGGIETPEHPPFDTDRDAVSLELIEHALTRNIPTLAICRGMQELNVACGGSLTAGLSGQENKLDHRTIEAEDHDTVYRARHGITFVEDGWLHRLTDRTQAQVNSLHNQAIDGLPGGWWLMPMPKTARLKPCTNPITVFASAFSGIRNIKRAKIICPNRCSERSMPPSGRRVQTNKRRDSHG